MQKIENQAVALQQNVTELQANYKAQMTQNSQANKSFQQQLQTARREKREASRQLEIVEQNHRSQTRVRNNARTRCWLMSVGRGTRSAGPGKVLYEPGKDVIRDSERLVLQSGTLIESVLRLLIRVKTAVTSVDCVHKSVLRNRRASGGHRVVIPSTWRYDSPTSLRSGFHTSTFAICVKRTMASLGSESALPNEVDVAIAEWIRAYERGEKLDREKFLANYTHLGPELSQFLSDYEAPEAGMRRSGGDWRIGPSCRHSDHATT